MQDVVTPDVLNRVTYEAHENANLKAKNGEIYRTCILWNLERKTWMQGYFFSDLEASWKNR